MSGESENNVRSNAAQPPPANGLVVVLGCFGLFYGLIAMIDPLL